MKISWYSHCPVLNPQWYLDNSLYSHESSSIALFYQGAYLLQSGPVQKICEEKIIDKKFISKKVSMYPLRLYLIFWSLNWNVRVWCRDGAGEGAREPEMEQPRPRCSHYLISGSVFYNESPLLCVVIDMHCRHTTHPAARNRRTITGHRSIAEVTAIN